MIRFHGILILLIANLSIRLCQDSGTIDFHPQPNLNDEESSSYHMPQKLKCDGCHILAHMLYESFRKEEQKLGKHKTLSESSVIDAVENVCESNFEQYGITDYNGQKRLKGPGLDTDKAPGVTQGGGKWPARLQQFCHSYVEELGEDYVYRKFRRTGQNPDAWLQTFRKWLCEESGPRLSHCRKNKTEL